MRRELVGNKFYAYMSHLHELGFDTFDKLDNYEKDELTAYKILDTDIKSMPKLEDFDANREIMTMLSKWIETEDQDIGLSILEKLKSCAKQAFEQSIKDEIEDYARQQQAEQQCRSRYDEFKSAPAYSF